jgi:signal transduction histidine kinase
LVTVLISKREIELLSAEIRMIIDGKNIDLRDNREGALSILKNDIYTLAVLKNEQVDALKRERDMLKDTLADISHQIKTPLTSMSLMTDLLLDAPPEKQAEFIANIRSSLTRTEWLVSALLKMAKLEAGAITFSRVVISAKKLTEIAVKPLRILFDIKNQRIETDGDAELYCDILWTAEALTNVLKNASEHSPDGSVIIIHVGANPLCAWISVTDSGKGISKSEIADIFKRFQGSRSDIGYGIGLPLSLAIMRSQNGDIEVEDSGGAGATFTLKLYC